MDREFTRLRLDNDPSCIDHTLEREIANNDKLASIYKIEDPDEIAKTMINKCNKIINKLASTKVSKVKSHDNNNLVNETKRKMESIRGNSQRRVAREKITSLHN